MHEPIDPSCDGASILYNLPGYRVLAVGEHPEHGRWVDVESTARPVCTGCGTPSTRVHSTRPHKLRDIPVAGPVTLIWRKRRFTCLNTACDKVTFSEATEQVPAYARSTGRLKVQLAEAVAVSGRAAGEVARAFRVSWWLVQSVLTAAAGTAGRVDDVVVLRLGMDEHRFRRVRFFRDEPGKWRRYEPWMSTIVDLDTGDVLGIVDGRNAGVAEWLAARPQSWRDQIEVVAIDPSAAFRKAIAEQLPRAAVSVDRFHLVKLANDMLTEVRGRVLREQNGRRGRSADPAWAHRLLLLRGGDTLTDSAVARLKTVFATGDPTDEIGAAWGVKEQLRMMLAASALGEAAAARNVLEYYVTVAAMTETSRLLATIDAWWPQIEVLITTGVTNAKTEAAATTIKQIKRTGRGFRNPANYKARTVLANAA